MGGKIVLTNCYSCTAKKKLSTAKKTIRQKVTKKNSVNYLPLIIYGYIFKFRLSVVPIDHNSVLKQ